MTVLPVVNHRRFIGAYELNITARLVGVDEAKYMTALIVHTTRAYVYLTKLIEAGAVKVPDTHNVSAEVAVGDGYVFEPFTETRVTIFCWNHKIDLTLHSSDTPQQALDLYYAMEAAKLGLDELFPNATQSNDKPVSSVSTHETDEERAKVGLQVQNGTVRVNGKKAAKELPARSHFIMPIAQIGAVMSRDGKLTWELFGFYGGKAGQYCDLVVYADNEIAIKNGLVASLEAIINKPGSAITGNWVAAGAVGEKEGKKSLYTNAIAETEELLAIARERGDKHPGMADDLPSVS